MTHRTSIHAFVPVLAILLALAPGCGDDMDDPDAAGLDASTTLDGATSDAARVDAGPDTDAGAGDAGGGVDAGHDAGTPEPCSPAGAIDTVPCGSCGTVERFCPSSLFWAYGTCEGEGACAPGALETSVCGDCGEQMRRCTTTCEWEDLGVCADEGECAPGVTRTGGTGCPAGEAREFTCSDACAYEPTSACEPAGCETPGATETIPCGRCGTQQRFCNIDRIWETDACMGEGVCAPGSTGSEDCGMCGTQATRCNTECMWVPVSGSACAGEGVCAPGARRRTDAGCPAGQTRLLECSASCGFTIVVEPCATSVPVDVLLTIDGTASNWSQFQTDRALFTTRCVEPLLALVGVQVGLAYYGDFSPADPFIGAVEIGPATATPITTSVATQTDIGGGDDSAMEMLHILTGGTPAAGALPFVCSSGRVAGGCWRPGATRVIAIHTDENARGGPEPTSTGLWNAWPTGPSWTTVEPRLEADDTVLFFMLDDDTFGTPDPVSQYTEMLADLGQPATDVQIEPAGSGGIGPVCDALVARVRGLAGL